MAETCCVPSSSSNKFISHVSEIKILRAQAGQKVLQSSFSLWCLPHFAPLPRYLNMFNDLWVHLVFVILPGHIVVQVTLCTGGPSQKAPPFRGAGLVQLRVRRCQPRPQRALHSDHSVQEDQPPLTDTETHRQGKTFSRPNVHASRSPDPHIYGQKFTSSHRGDERWFHFGFFHDLFELSFSRMEWLFNIQQESRAQVGIYFGFSLIQSRLKTHKSQTSIHSTKSFNK